MKVLFRGIGMNFGSVRVLDDINLSVTAGEFVCILGPSGCGKSTLLNIAGGFVAPMGGEVRIDGEKVTGPDPRRIFVFQERGVFPWLTVEENIGFGLFRQGEKEKRERIAHYGHRRRKDLRPGEHDREVPQRDQHRRHGDRLVPRASSLVPHTWCASPISPKIWSRRAM